MSSETIIKAIQTSQHPVNYPVKLLEKMGIVFTGDVDAKGNINLCNLPKTSMMWQKFAHALSMPSMRMASFPEMEDVYLFRGPIVKNLSLFPFFLRALAEEYQKWGVKYAELSISDVVKTEWMRVIVNELPSIEKDFGVQLRFLVAIWRHSPKLYIRDMLAQIMAYEKNPYIVGVDFMGHETNSTEDFIFALDVMNKFKQKRPDWVIRVHSGESECHPKNSAIAIEHGATRIGHGLHGVDPELLDLAKKHNVTIEVNISSNLCMNNAVIPDDIPFKKYLQHGIKITLGTDGQGCYGTSHQMEALLATQLGLDLQLIRKWDEEYIAFMKANAPTPGELLPVLPAPKCPADEWKKVDEARKAQRQNISTMLQDTLQIKAIEPDRLGEFFNGRVPLLFAGATSKSWKKPVPKMERDLLSRKIYQFLGNLDPSRVVLITGGTDFGLEKRVHQAVWDYSLSGKEFTLLGTLATELQATEDRISRALTNAVIIDNTWYDLAPFILKEVSKHKGVAYFIGGGEVVKNMIQIAKNLGQIEYFLMNDIEGTSAQMARVIPERGFSKSDGLEKILVKSSRSAILRSITLDRQEAQTYLRTVEKPILMFLGFSTPYHDPAELQKTLEYALSRYKPQETLIAAGATEIGIGAVYAIAKKKGFETLGIVSTKAKESGVSISPDADFVIYIESNQWGGYLSNSKELSPVSWVIANCSKEAILCGGGPTANAEAEAMLRFEKDVIHFPLERSKL